MAKDIYIVSDVHGNWKALVRALDEHGLLQNPNAFVVQLGDLANCVADSVGDDIHCLGFVGNEIDLMLVGNHEIPYFDRQNTFSGFHWNVVIDERLRELRDRGLLVPSYFVGETLITHAGVTASQYPVRFLDSTDPQAEIHFYLESLWADGKYGHALFSDCGKARYGTAHVGGMLWCDFDDEFEPTDFPQVVGHTARGLHQKGNALCIDTIRSTGLPTVLKIGG